MRLVVGAGFEPAKPEGKRFWRGMPGTIRRYFIDSEVWCRFTNTPQSLLVDHLSILQWWMAPLVGLAPAKLLDENQGTLLICLQRHLLKKRIFCTSTYHLTASSWLLVDLAMILACCCIGVASDHTLLCRKRKNQDTFDTLRYQLRYSPKLDGGTGGTQTHNLRLWMQVELLYVSFKWYLDRAMIPEPSDYGVETKTWTWIFS